MGIHKFILLTLLTLPLHLAFAEDDETEELLTAGELLKSCEEGSTPGSPNQYCMRYLFGYIITQQFAVYKLKIDETRVNIYGEAAGARYYHDPILLNCLIDRAIIFIDLT